MIRKPAPKPARKPAPKPAPQPAPKPASKPAPPQDRQVENEIILSFAGGEYGTRNDAEAKRIADKYNLSLVRSSPPESPIPKYLFRVNGDFSNLAGIRNEPGIGYVEPNSRQYSGPVSEQTMLNDQLAYERLNAALSGRPAAQIPQRPQVSPGNYNDAMARQDYNNIMRDQMAELAARQALGQMSPIPDGPIQNIGAAPSPRGDFIDTREPGRSYLTDMVDYIDPATGENTSRTRGVVPAPGSRFVRVGSSMPVQNPNYDAAMARQTYNNLMRDQMAMYAAQQASASNSQFLPGVPPPPAPAVPQVNPQAANNFANLTLGASVARQQPSQPKPSQPFAQPAARFGGQRPRQSRAQAPGFAPIQAL